jgi:hypothetical protein
MSADQALAGFEGYVRPGADPSEEEVTPIPASGVTPPPNSAMFELLSFAENHRVPVDLARAFFDTLQCDEDTAVEYLGFMTSEEIEDALASMVNPQGMALTPPERAKLRKLHNKASVSASEPPAPAAGDPSSSSSNRASAKSLPKAKPRNKTQVRLDPRAGRG